MIRLQFTVDVVRGICNAENHLLRTGMGPFCVDGFSLPGGLSKGTDYWITVPLMLVGGTAVPNPHVFQFAQSYRNAVDGVPIDMTTPGIGPFELQGHRIMYDDVQRPIQTRHVALMPDGRLELGGFRPVKR